VNLYLVRHGEALPKEQDPERPLSTVGVETAKRVGAFLGVERLGGVAALYFSTKLRARQTAEILMEAAGLRLEGIEVPGLEPLADVEPSIELLERASGGDLMLVGHLPHLSRLASRLVAGDSELEAFSFPAGGVLCLHRTAEGSDPAWRAAWFLAPELIDGGR
jgi:phosphohistidine phosphatase